MKLSFILWVAQLAAAVEPLVALPYSKYQGTALGNGLSQWLGIRFAAPPVGELRFRRPQDPSYQSGVQKADKHGKTCLPVGGSGPDDMTSEDCLFLDVYAPTHATEKSKLPVFVFIQGGGFAENSNPNLNGSGLIAASGNNIVVVTFNYRVGPYGFLAGREVERGGDLNAGLYDQRKVFTWVKRYIRRFGGDPDHVVLGGDSAGGQSVALHLTAYGGRDEGLFVGAAAESVSTPVQLTSRQSQPGYNALVKRAGCRGQERDTLACLRKLSATELQAINVVETTFQGQSGPPIYLYGPTLDGRLVPDYTYRLYARGKVIKVPTIMGDDTNGGTIFTPRNTSSYRVCNSFLSDNFPYLTSRDTRRIDRLYPVQDFPQNFPDSSRFWRQCSQAYGDMRYKCPGTFFSTRLAAQKKHSLPTWNYRYNVLDPEQAAEGLGVPHTVELNAIFGPTNVVGDPPASYFPGGVNAAIVPEIQAYWTSFIRALDPNVHRLEGSAEWKQWSGRGQDRLLFQVKPKTSMETVSGIDQRRCAFYNDIGIRQHQ